MTYLFYTSNFLSKIFLYLISIYPKLTVFIASKEFSSWSSNEEERVAFYMGDPFSEEQFTSTPVFSKTTNCQKKAKGRQKIHL